VHDHGHFKCESCGEVFDIEMEITGPAAGELQGFTVHRTDLLLWGTCPACAKKAKSVRNAGRAENAKSAGKAGRAVNAGSTGDAGRARSAKKKQS
jgi:hypothetical protein